MQQYFYQLKILSKRILLLFFFYFLCRIIFFFYNHTYFSSSSLSEILQAFIYGIKFDAAAIIMTNSLFAFLHILPLKSWNKKWYQLILKWLFIIINSVCLLPNCVDFVYFKFIAKRTTADLFQMFSLGSDMQNTLPQMAVDFWYILLIWIVLVFFMIRLYSKIRIRKKTAGKENIYVHLLKWFFVPVIFLAGVIVARGGIQLKPMGILAASKYSSHDASLVLNTPFTIIKTFGKFELEDVKYMSEAEAQNYFSLNHQYKKNQSFRSINIVVIILESFSKEYIGGLNNYEGYSPFLDSLINESLVFTNAYANSKKSIEGVPAVVASIPALMNEPYITSAYNSNKINSLASLLKKKNYSTGFFHGGNNGTMGFDNFALSVGFDFYKGREEYGSGDYDGNWGIYDDKFYKFFVDEMNKMKEPFLTCFFSISSHHPYSIPAEYKNKFKKGTLPIHESVMYADYSLKTFFENAEKQSWFDSTLFIITSDHTGPAELSYYQNKLGIYAVPVLLYRHHSTLKEKNELVTQHCDILPTVLDYLNYDEPFSAFGNSVFDTTITHFAVNYLSDSYQLITDDLLLQFDGEKNTALYAYRSDSLLKNNILPQHPEIAQKNSLLLKSIIQQFNHSMIHNEIEKK